MYTGIYTIYQPRANLRGSRYIRYTHHSVYTGIPSLDAYHPAHQQKIDSSADKTPVFHGGRNRSSSVVVQVRGKQHCC